MSPPAAPVSPARAKRLARVGQGVDACRNWLLEIVQNGLASSSATDRSSYEAMAARLVDFQAPGAARMVRQLGDVLDSGAGWEARWLDAASLLILFLEAFDQRQSLDEPRQEDIYRAVGFTTQKDDIPAESRIEDVWHVAMQKVFLEDRLTVQRSWIYGERCQRWLMHLSYKVAQQPFTPDLKVGRAIAGVVGVYPGALGMRGAFLSLDEAEFQPPPGRSLAENLGSYAETVAKFPWLEVAPMALEVHGLEHLGGSWFVIDENGERMGITMRDQAGWRSAALLALGPVQVYGEYDGDQLLGICAGHQGGFAVL